MESLRRNPSVDVFCGYRGGIDGSVGSLGWFKDELVVDIVLIVIVW